MEWKVRVQHLYFISGFADLVFSTCRPFFDKTDRLFALLGGRPKDTTYPNTTTAVFDLMMQEGLAANFHPKFLQHRRGRFAALNIGISHGQGTHHPVNLENHEHTEMAARLLASKHVQRMASFSDSKPFSNFFLSLLSTH